MTGFEEEWDQDRFERQYYDKLSGLYEETVERGFLYQRRNEMLNFWTNILRRRGKI